MVTRSILPRAYSDRLMRPEQATVDLLVGLFPLHPYQHKCAVKSWHPDAARLMRARFQESAPCIDCGAAAGVACACDLSAFVLPE